MTPMLILATSAAFSPQPAASTLGAPTVLAARVVDSQYAFGLINGKSFPERGCRVGSIESANQTANLTNSFHPWFPSTNATSLHLFIDQSSYDGSSSVSLEMAVSSTNSTTLFVQGYIPGAGGVEFVEFPPDSMAWNSGAWYNGEAAMTIDACPPSYCRMPADTNPASQTGCDAAPTTSPIVSTAVTNTTQSVTIDVTELLQHYPVLKLWTAQVNLFSSRTRPSPACTPTPRPRSSCSSRVESQPSPWTRVLPFNSFDKHKRDTLYTIQSHSSCVFEGGNSAPPLGGGTAASGLASSSGGGTYSVSVIEHSPCCTKQLHCARRGGRKGRASRVACERPPRANALRVRTPSACDRGNRRWAAGIRSGRAHQR
tara:strand:+ start:550 stop:1662 length:1113 start_codon:yes stop_codon:yes gene_type:complete